VGKNRTGLIDIRCIKSSVDKYLERVTKDSKELVSCTLSDYRRKSKTVSKNAITKVYNAKKNSLFEGKEALGRFSVSEDMDDLSLMFSGPVLSPIRFGMRPTAPKAGEKSYKLTQTVYKGHKEVIGEFKKPKRKGRKKGTRKSTSSPGMLFNLPAARNADGGINRKYIPGRRESTKRTDIRTYKTTSVAGMVRNEDVQKQIIKESEGYLIERLEHHHARLMAKHK